MAALFRLGPEREGFRGRVVEAFRFGRMGSGAVSLGVAALVWVLLARAFLPAGAPPDWYRGLAGSRGSVYAALYPLFYVVFVLLCPVLGFAPVIRRALIRRLRGRAHGQHVASLTKPSAMRAAAEEVHRPHPRKVDPSRARLRAAIAAQVAALSVLAVIGLSIGGTGDTIGLVLGIATCALALFVWRRDSSWGLSILLLLGVAQFATFLLVLREAPLPLAYRPLWVLTASFYLATPAYLIGLLLPRPRTRAVIALGASLTVGACAVEAVSTWVLSLRGGLPDVSDMLRDSDYVLLNRGPREDHPEMGPIPVPNSVTETVYPDDPRGYFQVRSPAWRLATGPSSVARLDATSDGIGVLIARADDPEPFRIYAERRGLALEEGTEYVLRFQIRATRERLYRMRVTAVRPPGEGLGLFFTDTIGPEWKTVTRGFTASLSADSARVDLRLGGDTTSVFVSDIVVRRADDGVRVDGGSGLEHYVSYGWNSRGCRAPEYPIPPGPGTLRVMALGDSYTMGQGVHAEDVFTSVMERLLRGRIAESGGSQRVEVLGCGVSHFSTREESLYYEARASAYQPDLVLLVMVADDDRSTPGEERLGVVRPPARWEYLSATASLVRSVLTWRPKPTFSVSMAELARLHDRVRADGADLAVVVFTNGADPAWDRLSVSADATAQELGVPILNLRDALASEDPAALVVHPVDSHPNERAHRIAAEEIVDWLEREGLIGLP